MCDSTKGDPTHPLVRGTLTYPPLARAMLQVEERKALRTTSELPTHEHTQSAESYHKQVLHRILVE